jgi:eukaryotic-like serine/threonine-protein kinase
MQQIGKYQLIHKLATGGMAEVFLAKAAGPMGFEKLCVLKRILPHLASELTFVDMFLSEARLAAQLNHPNIVNIFDFGEAEGTYFLAMEYVDGPNLREMIRRASGASLSLPIAFCARVISAACEGLAFAHDFKDPATNLPMNIVHRDISPDNLLLSRQGAVKVVDFGIAKAAGQSPHTQTGVLKGKLAYMSPEQLRNEPLDRRADVYALGVVLYELLTGLKPFIATSEAGMVQAILFEMQIPVAQRRLDVPEGLQRILAKALAKERERRYPDCASFQADLEEFLLSTGKPMGASQIAVLVAMMTAGPEGPMALGQRTSSSPRSNPRFSQSQPPVEAAPMAPVRPSTDPVPMLEARPPEGRELKEDRTSVERPSKLIVRAMSQLPQAAEPLPEPPSSLPPPNVSRPPEKDTVWVARIGVLLVLAGGGYLSHRVLASGRTSPVPSSATKPAPPQATPPPEEELLKPLPTEPRPPGGVPSSLGAQGPPESPVPAPPEPPLPPPDAERARAQGTVDLLVEPEADLYVDGFQSGRVRAKSFSLEAGKHTLRLVSPDRSKEVKRKIKVIAGQTTYVDINLTEE